MFKSRALCYRNNNLLTTIYAHALFVIIIMYDTLKILKFAQTDKNISKGEFFKQCKAVNINKE